MLRSTKAMQTILAQCTNRMITLSAASQGRAFSVAATEASSSSSSSSSSTAARVETEVSPQGVCRVVLNRPEKLNALDLDMFEAIATAAEDIRNDRSIRAVILQGKGRAFCTGLDVKSIVRKPTSINRLLERPSGYGPYDESDFKLGAPVGNLAQDVAILWREVPVPVIACLQGMCYGGGLQIALGCDFRFSTPDCMLSVMEGKYGLIPDMGASLTLRELVRIDVAKELTMTGRVITGEEAAKLGLVTRVCEDPLGEAEAMVEEILGRSPDAVAASKRLFQETWSNSNQAECLEKETVEQTKLLASWNQLAATGRAFGANVPFFSRKHNK